MARVGERPDRAVRLGVAARRSGVYDSSPMHAFGPRCRGQNARAGSTGLASSRERSGPSTHLTIASISENRRHGQRHHHEHR